jgi:hypothetical protein
MVKFEHFFPKLYKEGETSIYQLLSISQLAGIRRLGISFERVAIWTLVFTNAFFLFYFFAVLFRWV